MNSHHPRNSQPPTRPGEWSPAGEDAAASDLEALRREFDEAFYRANNPDVSFEALAPVVHFDVAGWREGRDPAPWFSVADYLNQHEDVRKGGGNPFLHYLLHGRREGRRIARSRASFALKASALAAAAAAPSKLQGYFENVGGGFATGWAFDAAQPTARLGVEIWAGPKLLCVGVADRDRADLKAAGIGDGRHAFEIRLPPVAPQEEPLIVAAKIAGAAHVIGRLPLRASNLGLQAVIEEVAGLTLTAVVTARDELAEAVAVDLWVDGRKIGAIEIPPLAPGGRHKASAALPLSLLDGAAHWFRLALVDSQTALVEDVLRTDVVTTPRETLQRQARRYPAFLSVNAHRRYVALERQTALAAEIVARQAPGPDRLSLEAYLAQLSAAHEQLLHGAAERAISPAPLTALAFAAPEVSVVVPAHDHFWATYNCLAALLLSPNVATYEIIVVDDGSQDRTKDLPRLVKNIVYLRNETALGFVKASNQGAAAARGRYVVMLNNDTEPGPGWLDELLSVFAIFPDAGIAGAKLIYPDGRLQEAGGIVYPDFETGNYGWGQNPNEPRFNYARQVDYVSGACLMAPRGLWEKLGGFDEAFAPAYFEDTDLAFRARELGLKTYYAPLAEVVHYEGLSNGVSTEAGVKRYQALNAPKFRRRWAAAIRALPSAHPELGKDRGVELRALVVDYKTPEPDRDAGSYAAVQEMRLLQALGFKVTFVSQSLAYMGDYTQDLQRRGVECLYAPYQTSIEEVVRNRGLEFDVFYITRYNVAQPYIDEIRASSPRGKIVFCNADLHFLREIRSALAAGDPDALATARQTREAELAVMRRVDVTLTYSDTEAAVILSHNLDETKVARCPWVADVREETPPFAARAGLAFLGGFNHAPNAEAVRYFLDEIMPGLRRAIPGIRLHVYGSNVTEAIRGLAAEDVVIEGYVERVEDVYDRHRVFVAPLRSGAGVKGKVVGALASGAPTVMTSVAAEGLGVSRGVEAAIADGADEWIEAVAALYRDEARWSDMSARARRLARENFSFARGVETMRAALAAAGVYVGD